MNIVSGAPTSNPFTKTIVTKQESIVAQSLALSCMSDETIVVKQINEKIEVDDSAITKESVIPTDE